jgi:hypothetical protein
MVLVGAITIITGICNNFTSWMLACKVCCMLYEKCNNFGRSKNIRRNFCDKVFNDVVSYHFQISFTVEWDLRLIITVHWNLKKQSIIAHSNSKNIFVIYPYLNIRVLGRQSYSIPSEKRHTNSSCTSYADKSKPSFQEIRRDLNILQFKTGFCLTRALTSRWKKYRM